MKKITLVLAMLLVVSAGFAQKKKVAVVTFFADKSVDLTDVGMGGAEIIADLANDPSFNLQPLLERYHTAFFNDYAKKFPFELVDEKLVTGKPEYQAWVSEYPGQRGPNNYVAIEGYKPISHNWGKKNETAMAKMFSEYDGVMFVWIDFAMQKGFGIGGTATTKMRATTNIALFNKKGEKVFNITEGENSKKTGVMAGGVPIMKPAKVLPMCESALEELMGDLDKRIEKIVKKSNQKL